MNKFLFPAVVLLNTFFVQEIFAAAPSVAEFPYEKSVILPTFSQPIEVSLRLDEAIMHGINSKFSNFLLVDSQNQEVPFRLYWEELGRIENARVMEVSSQKEGDMRELVDNDPLSTFVFDEKEDKRDPSWYLIDLGALDQVERINIFDSTNRIRYVEIKGGIEPDQLKTLVSKRSFNWQLDFSSPLVRYISISLWGVGVKIDDTKLYRGDRAEIYFEANPEEKYRVFYGGNVNSVRFKQKIQEQEVVAMEAQVSREQENELFPSDGDGDGFNNEDDNCPFVSNPLQRDSDKDRVGNDCDNAPDTKNANQYDTDHDGVGDVLDNCKLEQNEDQNDRDDDGYGDACDSAHAAEPGEFSPSASTMWGIGGGIVGVLVILFVWKNWGEIKKKAKKVRK